MNRRDKNNQVRRERIKKEGKRNDLLAKVRLWLPMLFFVSLLLYGARLYVYNKLLNSAGTITNGVIVDEKN